jgi:hypothetical protein
MASGIAVRGNVLAVTWTSVAGHVFLFDLEAQQRVAAWKLPPGPRGYCDAAGVAMDEHYHVFVADTNNDRVCHCNAFGRHLGDFGVPPPDDGDAGRDRPGVLDRPHALALRGDVLFVACGEQPRRRGVQRLTRQGVVLKSLPCRGVADAKYGAPRGLWVDDDVLLVADTLRGTIQRFRPDGTFLREWSCPVGATARPVAVAHRAGAVFVADRHDDEPLRAFGLDGVERPVADSLRRECAAVVGFAFDRQGRLLVLDHHGERVVRARPDFEFDQVVVDLTEFEADPPHGPGSQS